MSPPPPSMQSHAPQRRLIRRTWPGYLLLAYSITLLVIVISFRVSIVRGTSMGDTIPSRSLGFFQRVDPNALQRGDLVVIEGPTRRYIKRVIGLPTERVVLANGSVYIEHPDKLSTVRLLDSGVATGPTYYNPLLTDPTAVRFVVPEESLFVLSDAREQGLDSRSFVADGVFPTPFVPLATIRQKLIANLSKAGLYLHPQSPTPVQPVLRGTLPYCATPLPCSATQQFAHEACRSDGSYCFPTTPVVIVDR